MIENLSSGVYPLDYKVHLIFALIAGIFFLVRFIKYRKPYQITMFAEILVSFAARFMPTKYEMPVKPLFYIFGAVELLLLLATIILAVLEGIKTRKQRKNSEAS
jgi:hypothetical protein